MRDISASEAFGVVWKEAESRRNKAENRRQKRRRAADNADKRRSEKTNNSFHSDPWYLRHLRLFFCHTTLCFRQVALVICPCLCGVRDGSYAFGEPTLTCFGGLYFNTPAARKPILGARRDCSGIRNAGVRHPSQLAGSRGTTHTAQAEVFLFSPICVFSSSVLHDPVAIRPTRVFPKNCEQF